MLTTNTLLLKEYIKALIQNVDKTCLPKEFNLIFDGGAFNGGFAAGIAMYIKMLETHGFVKVNRVSGCSAGALVALWFVCGCKEEGLIYFEQIMNVFKSDFNLQEYQVIVREFVEHLVPLDQISLAQLNDKLFINFYDTRKNKQRVVSKFKNKEYLIECILRSSHLPYIIDGTARYKGRYLDGIVPYIFKNSDNSDKSDKSDKSENFSENLFVTLLTRTKFKRAFMLKSEKNIHFRLLAGVADANDFFTNGSSDMCGYVSGWGYSDIFLLRMREFFIFMIFSLIEWIFLLKNYLPQVLTKSLIYNGLVNALKGLCFDITERILIGK